MHVYLLHHYWNSNFHTWKSVFNSWSGIWQMHNKGARHRAALSKLKEREVGKQEEINKRIALSDNPTTSTTLGTSTQKPRLPCKPLIEHTRKAASEIFYPAIAPQNMCQNHSVVSDIGSVHHVILHKIEVNSHHTRPSEADAANAQLQLDFRERREKELKFTAAGWKHDCHGKWYRDENVGF